MKTPEERQFSKCPHINEEVALADTAVPEFIYFLKGGE